MTSIQRFVPALVAIMVAILLYNFVARFYQQSSAADQQHQASLVQLHEKLEKLKALEEPAAAQVKAIAHLEKLIQRFDKKTEQRGSYVSQMMIRFISLFIPLALISLAVYFSSRRRVIPESNIRSFPQPEHFPSSLSKAEGSSIASFATHRMLRKEGAIVFAPSSSLICFILSFFAVGVAGPVLRLLFQPGWENAIHSVNVIFLIVALVIFVLYYRHITIRGLMLEEKAILQPSSKIKLRYLQILKVSGASGSHRRISGYQLNGIDDNYQRVRVTQSPDRELLLHYAEAIVQGTDIELVEP
ncbi:hypothetical protein [Pleionea sp. CnH1-48]|uniref:hypothetical protein n=1 Tax=Pleionea sp. CnH1-48 TaxID=2954494 RepID=UPI00209828DA|nr:hypothetical protein [Pleionea sp. CnH1-48]MCO7225345.1 hypothetical protein [Pleionea sp. CnH1-48]